MADTTTLTRDELDGYVERALLSGRLEVTDQLANYTERTSIEQFKQGNDQAAAALRNLSLQIRSESGRLSKALDALVQKSKSASRTDEIASAADELAAPLEVGEVVG